MGHSRSGVMVGPHDLEGVFQSRWFYDSVIKRHGAASHSSLVSLVVLVIIESEWVVMVVLFIIKFSQFPSPNQGLLIAGHSVHTPLLITGAVLAACYDYIDMAYALQSIWMVESCLDFSWGSAAATAAYLDSPGPSGLPLVQWEAVFCLKSYFRCISLIKGRNHFFYVKAWKLYLILSYLTLSVRLSDCLAFHYVISLDFISHFSKNV